MNWKRCLSAIVAIAALLFPTVLRAQSVEPTPQDSGVLTELDLSAAQQAQIEHIRALATAQLQAVLTPQQWQQLQAQANGTEVSMADLNLSRQQLEQLNEIEALMSERLFALLTPAQIEKLQELMQP